MRGFFLVCENKNEKFDISFQINSEINDDIPEEQQELYVKAESACNIIKSLEQTDDSTKRKYFNKLLSLSQVGLALDPARTDTAELALSKLKEEMVLVEGRRIKNKYMGYLGFDALLFGVVISIILGVIYYFSQLPWVIPVLCIALGALTGTWISFGARKFAIHFEDLAELEKDRMSPRMRLVYIVITALVCALWLSVGIVTVEIGDVDTSKAFCNIKTAFVIGTFCGLVESRVGIHIYKKAVLLFNGDEK